jgi:HAD superfamily hydrolase (TIGR01509 family)
VQGGDGPGAGVRAVVLDVDGTLVDSERDGHRIAFNAAFAAHGLPYRWGTAEYGRLLAVTGGRRRLAAYLREQGHAPAEAGALAARLHRDKTRLMQQMVTDGAVGARPGVRGLLTALAAAGVTLAVATTGSRAWVAPLLARQFGHVRFAAVVTGTEVPRLKPDPAVYVETLARIGVPARAAVAVEDSAPGLRAARAAGLTCAVVTNAYTVGQDFTGAAAVYPDFAACRADPHGPLSTVLHGR